MSDWKDLLLPLGLVCPTVSWLTVIYGLLRARSEHGYSAVLVPFIGPVLLSAFILVKGHSNWLIPAVWILDIGTVAFCAVLPFLVVDWWRYSKLTQLASMQGRSGIERVGLSFHRSERYRLEKVWDRHDPGICGLGEIGRFSNTEHGVALVSDTGLCRQLTRTGPTTFLVQEQDGWPSMWHDHSIEGWSLIADREFGG